MIIKSRLLYILYMLIYREIKKWKKNKLFCKKYKKKSNQKTWKKQKCKREEICVPFNLRKQQNETKVIIIFIYIGVFLIYTTILIFWCSKKKENYRILWMVEIKSSACRSFAARGRREGIFSFVLHVQSCSNIKDGDRWIQLVIKPVNGNALNKIYVRIMVGSW